MDKFDAMQVFVRVVEKGSFSAVAKERGIGQPAVSKQISALEDELGTELMIGTGERQRAVQAVALDRSAAGELRQRAFSLLLKT